MEYLKLREYFYRWQDIQEEVYNTKTLSHFEAYEEISQWPEEVLMGMTYNSILPMIYHISRSVMMPPDADLLSKNFNIADQVMSVFTQAWKAGMLHPGNTKLTKVGNSGESHLDRYMDSLQFFDRRLN
jgi:hypothetical protein